MYADFVYLASGSPRRRELLTQIGVRFRVLQVEVDEACLIGEGAAAYVSRLARHKAQAGRAMLAGLAAAPVLAADTAVVLDGRFLVKPVDAADAGRMLHALSDRTHEVLTAIVLATSQGMQLRTNRSEVTFRAIGAAEARAYWETGEPQDKAGGYAIQGLAAVFVAGLAGSYSGVMGLPLFETAQLLEQARVARWCSN